MSVERIAKFLKKSPELALALGNFTISTQIGQGANGIVYKATFSGGEVAIKFLYIPSREVKSNKFERFLAEYFNIISQNALLANGIIRYFNFEWVEIRDESGSFKVPIIIMKLYEASLSSRNTNKNEEEFFRLFNFLLDTLEKVHTCGIIHRDIKPENILVSKDTFTLTDFGIASFNPKMFNLRAKTKTKERVGNRLFSAPEQEEVSAVPHTTMDIYAMGQVLQWYATEKTHRGTGRERITKAFPNTVIYDSIIEKCLENNPTRRFQTIQEIREYIKSSREKDVWESIRLFSQVCRSSFPKHYKGFLHSDNVEHIDRLLATFKENEADFDGELWWRDGIGNADFKLEKVSNGVWLFDGVEYNIREIWLYRDTSLFNDFILVHHLPCEPIMVNGKPEYYLALVDGKIPISNVEKMNGFAEINGEIIDLSKHNVQVIEKEEKKDFSLFVLVVTACLVEGMIWL